MTDFDWVDNTNDDDRLRAEVKRLRVRVDELLVTIRNLSASTPYPEEAGNAAVLIAEVGTLKAEVARLTKVLDDRMCQECGGAGEHCIDRLDGRGEHYQDIVSCPACNGDGRTEEGAQKTIEQLTKQLAAPCERCVSRDTIHAVSRLEERENRTAEAIAAWLDSWLAGVEVQPTRTLSEQIRAGAWRKEQP